jgi:hypothetical protein
MNNKIKINWKLLRLSDVYWYNIIWDYIIIEFNEWNKFQVFNLNWEQIEINWINEFYWCDIKWDCIRIQFNRQDEILTFNLKDYE